MHLTDTHTHLFVPEFDNDREDMLKRALEKGIDKFFLPNIDAGSIEAVLALSDAHPDICFPMAGLHPCSVFADYETQLELIKPWELVVRIVGSFVKRKFWPQLLNVPSAYTGSLVVNVPRFSCSDISTSKVILVATCGPASS